MYKPCSKFVGKFDVKKAVFLCNDGLGHPGQFVYIRDEREEEEFFGLCEVEVFQLKSKSESQRAMKQDKTTKYAISFHFILRYLPTVLTNGQMWAPKNVCTYESKNFGQNLNLFLSIQLYIYTVIKIKHFFQKCKALALNKRLICEYTVEIKTNKTAVKMATQGSE